MPLFHASTNCDLEAIETLIVFGAEIDVVETFARQTPLLLCAMLGRKSIVRLLLSLNADTMKTDIDGKTVFELAQRHEKIQRMLTKHSKKSVKQRFCFLI